MKIYRDKLLAKMITDDEHYRNRLLNGYLGHLTTQNSPARDLVLINDTSSGGG